jgi:hypothetical protein
MRVALDRGRYELRLIEGVLRSGDDSVSFVPVHVEQIAFLIRIFQISRSAVSSDKVRQMQIVEALDGAGFGIRYDQQAQW